MSAHDFVRPHRLLFASTRSQSPRPGPGIAAVVARVLARGTSGVWAFIAGFLAGDLIWFTFAAAGLTALANTFGAVFVALKYAGAAYLLWMAWRMWTSPAAAVDVDAALDASGKALSGCSSTSLSLTLGNPKVIVFFLALLPTVIDLQNLSLAATMRDLAADGRDPHLCARPLRDRRDPRPPVLPQLAGDADPEPERGRRHGRSRRRHRGPLTPLNCHYARTVLSP